MVLCPNTFGMYVWARLWSVNSVAHVARIPSDIITQELQTPWQILLYFDSDSLRLTQSVLLGPCHFSTAAVVGGTSVEGHSWSGLPSSNWDSFVSPSRYIGSLQHHDTPDAHLAWLIATISAANTGAGGAPSATGDAKVQRPVFYIAPKPLTGIPDYTWRSQGTYGAGLYRNKEVAASAADSDTPGVDLSAAAELLEQLASLSKGVRWDRVLLWSTTPLLTSLS